MEEKELRELVVKERIWDLDSGHRKFTCFYCV